MGETVGNSVGNGAPSKENIPGIRDGWFSETETMWPGQRFSLALENFSVKNSVLFHGRSDHQDILVFRSAQYGNVLVLDGVLQLTERDEFAYHEMMAHLPLFSHPDPKRVLIVGGGDGAILRQVCKHECVQEITVVEIDPMVVKVAKEHFHATAVFDDPRVSVVHMDGAEYLQNTSDRSGGYDVILADTLDPLGPAESLFEPEFYELTRDALNPGGVLGTQGECFWIHRALLRDIVTCCRALFGTAEYASTMVPSFPCGQIGFVVARIGDGRGCRRPVRAPTNDMQQQLRWYDPQVHRASFVLPHYLRLELDAPENGGEVGVDDDSLFERDDEDNTDCFFSKCTIQ